MGIPSLVGKNKAKQVLTIRTDYQVSIAKLCRSLCYHQPKLIIAHGQGALIALGLARPYVLELSLQTRNVQRQEAQRIGEAWGNIRGIVALNPRMFKKGLMLDLLRPALPELFKNDCPVEDVRSFCIKSYKSSHYEDEKTLGIDLKLEMIENLSVTVLQVSVAVVDGHISSDNAFDV